MNGWVKQKICIQKKLYSYISKHKNCVIIEKWIKLEIITLIKIIRVLEERCHLFLIIFYKRHESRRDSSRDVEKRRKGKRKRKIGQ